MAKPAKFTKGEGEFFAHRLTLPEALAEVIAADDQNDEAAYLELLRRNREACKR